MINVERIVLMQNNIKIYRNSLFQEKTSLDGRKNQSFTPFPLFFIFEIATL